MSVYRRYVEDYIFRVTDSKVQNAHQYKGTQKCDISALKLLGMGQKIVFNNLFVIISIIN